MVKTAGMAGSVLDSLRVLEALAESPMPAIVIAMGEYGLISRLLSLRYESCVLTYASLDTGEPVAPGQLSVSDMRDVYHAQSIGPETKVFGVLNTTQPPDRYSARSMPRHVGLGSTASGSRSPSQWTAMCRLLT